MHGVLCYLIGISIGFALGRLWPTKAIETNKRGYGEDEAGHPFPNS